MKFLTLFVLLTLSFGSAFAQGKKDKKLRAYLDHKQFYAPGLGNYVEFHLQFAGYSINYKGKDDGLIGEVGIRVDVKQGDKSIQSDAYRLETPFMKDSIVEDFYDIRRFALSPGEYTLDIELMDMNSSAESIKATQSFTVEEYGDAISISDLEVAEVAGTGDESSMFYKSGYNIIPRLSTFYPEELNTIPVYFELYNTNQLEDSVFAIRQTLVNAMSGVQLDQFTAFSRHKTSNVVPIIKRLDISEVPTGKYIVSYTLINRNMTELSTQSYTFERSNDRLSTILKEDIILDPAFQESMTDDSVEYYLESLIPIARPNEVRNIIKIAKAKDNAESREHIQLFWATTAPGAAYESWMKYKAQVQLVEKLYANNFQEGFETDRGRVYLQYGSPTNIIRRDNNPSEYPFEIWIYNKIGVFSNRRFVFYNPDLVNNAYRLLHSDMVGELKNPSWQRDLSRRNTTNGDIDNPNAGTNNDFGGNADEYYRQY